MGTVLGIDTATSGCAAALIRGDVCLAQKGAFMARGQSEALTPMIADVVAAAGVAFDEIGAIAVTRGPGAFTGLRIGLSAARAMALALNVPCLGIGTFDALRVAAQARGVNENADALVVAVESKREEQFIAIFDGAGQAVGAPQAIRPSDVAAALAGRNKVAVVGDAGLMVADALRGRFDVTQYADIDLPDPAVVARLGLAVLATPEAAPATPVYLRPPDVSLPKR